MDVNVEGVSRNRFQSVSRGGLEDHSFRPNWIRCRAGICRLKRNLTVKYVNETTK